MPRKIVIDTDPGVDDVLAILMALASPEVDVALISIVFGNTHAPVAYSNLLKIYYNLALEVASIPSASARYARLAAQDKTVLALGEDRPIGGEKAVAAYFHGPDGLSNISVTNPEFTPPVGDPDDAHPHLILSKSPAYKAILELLAAEPEGSVTIVSLGPLTNLAHALREDPKTFGRVGEVVWMGGALDVPGNTSPSAEFNCFADPYAADQILAACREGLFRLVMAPLDITTPHQIPFTDLIHPPNAGAPGGPKAGEVNVGLQSSEGAVTAITPLQKFTSSFLLRVRGLQASFGNPDAMEMHDPVAVWYTIARAAQVKQQRPTSVEPEGWTTIPREFKIERIGELTRGMTVVDRRGTGESVGNRTEDTSLLGNSLPVGAKAEVDESKKNLPRVIKTTPGVVQLRGMLLGRVFGVTV